MKPLHRTCVEMVLLIALIAVGFQLTRPKPPAVSVVEASMLTQIQQAYQEKRYADCERMCRQQLVIEPGDLTWSRWLGMAQREQGQTQQAQQTFDQAIASVSTPAKWVLFPHRIANLHRERAFLLKKTKGPKAAQQDAAAAVELLEAEGATVDPELYDLAQTPDRASETPR
jgi:hypothetical protein